MTDLELVRERLREFAEREAAGVSPLYEHLASKAADDPDVAGLLTAAPREFAYPELLLAAVHRVVQAEPFHRLSDYYPSLGGTHGVDSGTWPLVREFVLERADRVRALVATRSTQTNEVRRAAQLFPAVAVAAKRAGGRIGLLEVGASAGLLLGLDRYSYRYQTQAAGPIVAGPAKAALGLHCALEVAPGAELPKLPKKIDVGARVALDRMPADLTDEDSYAWLEACVWADQPERLRLFGVAATVQRKDPPVFVEGDAVDDLGKAAELVPADLPLVVITSSVLPYLPGSRQAEFVTALAALAAERPLWWISNEVYGDALEHVLPGRDDLAPGPGEQRAGVLGLTTWEGGEPRSTALARTAVHGQRLTWLV
jgi:hypothetical protein